MGTEVGKRLPIRAVGDYQNERRRIPTLTQKSETGGGHGENITIINYGLRAFLVAKLGTYLLLLVVVVPVVLK